MIRTFEEFAKLEKSLILEANFHKRELQQLQDIAKTYAAKTIKAIYGKFENLQMFPEIGSDLSKRLSFRTDYKYAVWTDYVIIYKVNSEYVEIYRVMNRYQDITRIFE